MFYADGQLAYPDLPAANAKGCSAWPATDVSTLPEYFGEAIVVNGKTWPLLQVKPTIYWLRILNGCNSRVLQLKLGKTWGGAPLLPFTVIGTEGGFLPNPVTLPELIMGGAERFEVLVDFSAFANQTLTLFNRGARKPFPGGKLLNPKTDGLVLQVRVGVSGSSGLTLPGPNDVLNTETPPNPSGDAPRRRVLLYEGRDLYGRIQPLLGSVALDVEANQLKATSKLWDDAVTENATRTVEIWEIFNTTVDSHPIHIHESFFSVLNRQPIAFDKKLAAPPVCGGINPTFVITVLGAAVRAPAQERGFKDTVLCPPGQVTRIAVDFTNSATGRFVWHCHILEHEDHEMMRPYNVT